jgi:hypothetical protein
MGKDTIKMHGDVAILPCETQANPWDTTTIEYFSPEQVGYILQKPERTRPTRIVMSSGDLGNEFALDSWHVFRHDQTGALLGRYQVVGIARYDIGQMVGDVPNRMLAYSVFK